MPKARRTAPEDRTPVDVIYGAVFPDPDPQDVALARWLGSPPPEEPPSPAEWARTPYREKVARARAIQAADQALARTIREENAREA